MTDPRRSLAVVAATFVALLALMGWGFGFLLDERTHPNRHVEAGAAGPRQIELEPNPAGQYLVPGQINGRDVTFLIDTGATHVAVPAHLADRLELTRGREIAVDTAGGRMTAAQTVIERMSVGGIEQRGVRGSLNPSLSGDYVLLGMTFLRHVDFRQQGDRLILEESAER